MTASTQAAQTLFNRRQPGVKAPRLAEAMRPKNILEALAIHDEMTKLAAVGGWKCLLPPAEDKIIAAPIFNVQQHSSIVTLFEDNDIARVEPEICFVLGKDLPAKKEGYSEAEIIDAISSAHMALELMQSRFADDAGQSFHESLADCLFMWVLK
jgi:2-keto-4-pentenoate hydratase